MQLRLSEDDGLAEDDNYYLGVHLPAQKDLNVVLAGNVASETFLLATAIEVLSKMDSSSRINLVQVPVNELVASDFDRADVVIVASLNEKLSKSASML